MSKFNYTPDELVTVSKMLKSPVLIVEGYDDIQIYQNIADSINKKVIVFASENLRNISNRIYTKIINLNWRTTNNTNCKINTIPLMKNNLFGKSGCEGVLASLREIDLLSKTENYDEYILGIIDKDVTDYRNTVNSNTKGLFILKYYSIESHFITHEHLDRVINNITKIPKNSINEGIKTQIFSNIYNDLSKLYYISLEALKNACIVGYSNVTSYQSDTARGVLLNPSKYNQIVAKKAELDEFAETLNINKSFIDFLKIVKGKWVFDYFVYLLKFEINNLKDSCKEKVVVQCQYCEQKQYSKCLYQAKKYDEDHVKNLIIDETELQSLNYIKSKINSMK